MPCDGCGCYKNFRRLDVNGNLLWSRAFWPCPTRCDDRSGMPSFIQVFDCFVDSTGRWGGVGDLHGSSGGPIAYNDGVMGDWRRDANYADPLFNFRSWDPDGLASWGVDSHSSQLGQFLSGTPEATACNALPNGTDDVIIAGFSTADGSAPVATTDPKSFWSYKPTVRSPGGEWMLVNTTGTGTFTALGPPAGPPPGSSQGTTRDIVAVEKGHGSKKYPALGPWYSAANSDFTERGLDPDWVGGATQNQTTGATSFAVDSSGNSYWPGITELLTKVDSSGVHVWNSTISRGVVANGIGINSSGNPIRWNRDPGDGIQRLREYHRSTGALVQTLWTSSAAAFSETYGLNRHGISVGSGVVVALTSGTTSAGGGQRITPNVLAVDETDGTELWYNDFTLGKTYASVTTGFGTPGFPRSVAVVEDLAIVVGPRCFEVDDPGLPVAEQSVQSAHNVVAYNLTSGTVAWTFDHGGPALRNDNSTAQQLHAVCGFTDGSGDCLVAGNAWPTQ